MSVVVTWNAPVNIALIKYWGKRDEKLILPLNDSISTTLSLEQMKTTTSVMRSPDFLEDKLWLNGNEESYPNPRLKRILEEIRRRAQSSGDLNYEWKVHICTENNFPTAAGLASSSAGYACLVLALANLFGVKGELTRLARQGSGSACRSLEGGFVHWVRGSLPDGSDSLAQQMYPADHWPSLRILIMVVCDKKKKISSTTAMQRSVVTSELIKHRVQVSVPQRVVDIASAIRSKNFAEFAEITMKDSNQFHAIALDTFPPAFYMTDESHDIIDFVHNYNAAKGATKVAYTFDAGPNACLYMEAQDVPEVAALIKHTFPPKSGELFTGIPITPTTLPEELAGKFTPYEPGHLQYCILTKVGSGPELSTDPECHLLTNDGIPKHLVNKVK